MQRQAQGWWLPVWLVALVVVSVGLSLGLACAVPLAAFAGFGALTLSRRDALALVLAVVLANQCVGFGLLHYPATPATFVWGAAFALVGIWGVLAASWVRAFGRDAPRVAVYCGGFLAAFVAYEGGLFVLTLLSSSGLEPYEAPIVLRIFAINAVAFVGLLAISWIVWACGSARKSVTAPGIVDTVR